MALESGVYEVRFIQGEAVVATGTFTLGGDADVVGPVEFQASATHLQWRSPVGTGTWTDLVALADLQGPAGADGTDGAPGADGADGAEVEMRLSGGWIQWKLTTDATWKNLFDTSTLGGGGTGDTTTIIVRGQAVTSASMGYVPTGDPVTDTQNLQTFVDNIATDRVDGYAAEGQWELEDQIQLPDGVRLHGLGMRRTIFNCDPANWNATHYTPLRMDTSMNNDQHNTNGVVLADFCVIGADKNRSDSGGGLIRLHGLYDFLVERLLLIDASSYGLFIAGYGVGDFTNDINSDFWNSTFRGTVRDCLAYRGQIGFGTEGGAENILFDRCTAIGNYGLGNLDFGLHAYRSASGYNVRYRDCTARGYRNGFLLDRYKQMQVKGCFIDTCRYGVAVGSFYDGEAISQGLQILDNYFYCVEENNVSPSAITDTYLSNRSVEGVIVHGNIMAQGGMSFRQCRQMVVSNNTSLQSGSGITCASNATGIVANNACSFSNSASGVTNGGNNVFTTGY